MSRLDQMIGDMFVQGVSEARVGTTLETLNGVKPSASTPSIRFPLRGMRAILFACLKSTQWMKGARRYRNFA
jgi:hypothetical protein